MFRNKIFVKASLPSSNGLAHFRLLTLTLSLSPLSIDVETLCWKLSRRWRLACLPHSSQILILYQISQSQSLAGVVQEVTDAFPVSNVGDEEEVGTSSLVARAIECGLRCFMLENGWSCVGENSFVRSSFAVCEEGKHVYAVEVKVQSDTDDGFIFIVSPDVVQFSRHRVVGLLGTKQLQKFNGGEEVILEEYNIFTSCTTLPSLYEGHVMGLCKQQPVVDNFERLANYYTFKHGISLPSDYFIFVRFTCGGSNGQWFPSNFVLQGSGFAPTPLRIRSSKAVEALESFLNILEAWNFFDQGFLKLRFQELSSLAIGTALPLWQKATSKMRNGMVGYDDILQEPENFGKMPKEMLLALDFRTPKPPMGSTSLSMSLEFAEMHKKATTSSLKALGNTINSVYGGFSIDSITTNRPLSRKPSKRSKHSEHRMSMSVNRSNLNEDEHTSEVHRKDQNQLEALEGNLFQKEEKLLEPNTEASRKLEKDEDFHVSSCPVGAEIHNKENITEGSKKMRTKQSTDQSDITFKVLNCYKKGKLQSLTVAEMKCFLASKKLKLLISVPSAVWKIIGPIPRFKGFMLPHALVLLTVDQLIQEDVEFIYRTT
ncbi:hypothetical protein J5N97_019585 [Dioscorea zingiberensis]|uniref:Uncharacterized protein n=1 Tax=Dioscorea zingiberensis TaxID=325984 RepID=A0A9D5HCF7_9LILI|nr:hypothetical protein J5N97_019585 [Dioscorea zingiberensis]